MKRLIIVSSIIASFSLLYSCSESSKFESEAMEQAEKTFVGKASHPESVKITDKKVVYADDSLCIINFGASYNNVLGKPRSHQYEYVYLMSNGKQYEATNNIDDNEAAFVTPEKYEEVKKNTIFQKLNYTDGLRYLVVQNLNKNGNEVGNKDQKGKLKLPMPCGIGVWELYAYKDEFGDEGAAKYIQLTCDGSFSDSANTDTETLAYFTIDGYSNYSFFLFIYKDLPRKDDKIYDFKVKDNSGNIYEFSLRNNKETGRITSDSSIYKETIKTILSNGGKVSVLVKERINYMTPTSYRFTMDLTGLEKAMELL